MSNEVVMSSYCASPWGVSRPLTGPTLEGATTPKRTVPSRGSELICSSLKPAMVGASTAVPENHDGVGR
jgi:hypothetical protein